MDWTPLGDRVIVRKLDDQKETSSGIILMNDQRTIKTAEVVAEERVSTLVRLEYLLA